MARWLATGRANPDIALILQVRSRTVEKHVEHILGKLDVENRTAAALIINDIDRREAEQAMDRGPERSKAIGVPCLSRGELRVADWLVRGKTNREISTIIDMRVRTVEKHVEKILGKLHVVNRTAAALVLAAFGWL